MPLLSRSSNQPPFGSNSPFSLFDIRYAFHALDCSIIWHPPRMVFYFIFYIFTVPSRVTLCTVISPVTDH